MIQNYRNPYSYLKDNDRWIGINWLSDFVGVT